MYIYVDSWNYGWVCEIFSLPCFHFGPRLLVIGLQPHNPIHEGTQPWMQGQIPHIPKSDPIWEAIQDGWWWRVISIQVEDAMPQFIQMALSASNSIHKAINEQELLANWHPYQQNHHLKAVLAICPVQGELASSWALPFRILGWPRQTMD